MDPPDSEEGIVVSSHRNRVLILDSNNQPLICTLKHGADRAVAGDLVVWRRTGKSDGLVGKIKPRRSLVFKPTEHGPGKPIAANVDQLMLVVAPRPAYLLRLIDRYLVTAAYFDIPACLIFNKVDLLNAADLKEQKAVMDIYSDIDVRCFWVSAKKTTGLETLANTLQGKCSILVGQSGVGKSSLTKRLTAQIDITVQSLSNRGATGRHTTSHTTLYPLTNEGWIMDSPGVREFELWQIPVGEIATGFAEFRPFLGQCRFRDCRHDVEPGCAIAHAVERGAVSEQRLGSYREMLTEQASRD